MKKGILSRLAIQWIFDQCENTEKRIVDILEKRGNCERGESSENLKRLMHDYRVLNVLKSKHLLRILADKYLDEGPGHVPENQLPKSQHFLKRKIMKSNANHKDGILKEG